MMMQSWKFPYIVKGILTWVPPLNALRLRYNSTGGTDSSRYCYAVWLRHLVVLNQHGFRIAKATVGELGPGDSIGSGLAALLSGAKRYVGLDAFPFSAKADLEKILNDLIEMYLRRERIPNLSEFPKIRPQLDSYEFPEHAIDLSKFDDRAERIREELGKGVNNGQVITYRAPWTSDDISLNSLDLIFSQGVLQCVDALPETYRAMFAWLKPGGFSSHVIGCWAAYLSPFWNGLWAYSDWEWKLVRGRRQFLFNREPLSTHLQCARKAGFEILLVKRDHGNGGLKASKLAKRFQSLSNEDLQTRGAMLILRKPC